MCTCACSYPAVNYHPIWFINSFSHNWQQKLTNKQVTITGKEGAFSPGWEEAYQPKAQPGLSGQIKGPRFNLGSPTETKGGLESQLVLPTSTKGVQNK